MVIFSPYCYSVDLVEKVPNLGNRGSLSEMPLLPILDISDNGKYIGDVFNINMERVKSLSRQRAVLINLILSI